MSKNKLKNKKVVKSSMRLNNSSTDLDECP